jgi:hypothetical protein
MKTSKRHRVVDNLTIVAGVPPGGLDDAALNRARDVASKDSRRRPTRSERLARRLVTRPYHG